MKNNFIFIFVVLLCMCTIGCRHTGFTTKYLEELDSIRIVLKTQKMNDYTSYELYNGPFSTDIRPICYSLEGRRIFLAIPKEALPEGGYYIEFIKDGEILNSFYTQSHSFFWDDTNPEAPIPYKSDVLYQIYEFMAQQYLRECLNIEM